ncbi:MAG: hypothetical protein Q8O92_16220 [Candidatus Latescibacter sp.]|nr:hypothetical protein [Candidatus Latescibacter sp.]
MKYVNHSPTGFTWGYYVSKFRLKKKAAFLSIMYYFMPEKIIQVRMLFFLAVGEIRE